MTIPTEAFCAGLVLLIVFLCNTSNVFCYYTKFLIYILLSIFFTAIFIPFMLWRPRHYKNGLWPAWGGRQISKVLGVKWELRGQKNLVEDSGSIILMNHQSAIDLLVLGELWPIVKRCSVVVKREVFYMWPFGLAAWLWGTVFIDRMNGPRARNAINKAAETITTKKAKICMFPEGTRHGGDELLPFKKGAFHIAITSQVPIQPIVMSKYYFLNSETHTFNSGKSIINILPPIETKGLKKEDIDTLMQKTYSIMNNEFKSLSKL